MGGREDRKRDWRPRIQGGADGILYDFQRCMGHVEAFGTMAQVAMRLQPALNSLQTRKPEQGLLSIQDRTNMFANALSPHTGS